MSSFRGSLDANVILRLLLNDVPAHYKAAKKLLLQSEVQLAVADAALIEVIFVLNRNYGMTREQVHKLITGFISLPQINCNRVLFTLALPLYINNESLSFEDCALTVYAELNDALPLYTFDKKLAKSTKNAALVGA
jgi:predicted nucleic-acid-binding protein